MFSKGLGFEFCAEDALLSPGSRSSVMFGGPDFISSPFNVFQEFGVQTDANSESYSKLAGRLSQDPNSSSRSSCGLSGSEFNLTGETCSAIGRSCLANCSLVKKTQEVEGT